MKKKKSLQKFTNTDEKIKYLFSLEQMTYHDIREVLNNDEISMFNSEMRKRSEGLKGEEYDEFWHKVYKVIPEDSRHALWEYNHSQITAYMSEFIHEGGRIPHISELVKRTGLSRQTISKHLKEYKNSELFREQQEQLVFLREKVLAKLFSFATTGDVKAARLFLECTSGINEKKMNVTNNTQNNFIQINGKILTQDFFNRLNPQVLEIIQKDILLID